MKIQVCCSISRSSSNNNGAVVAGGSGGSGGRGVVRGSFVFLQSRLFFWKVGTVDSSCHLYLSSSCSGALAGFLWFCGGISSGLRRIRGVGVGAVPRRSQCSPLVDQH